MNSRMQADGRISHQRELQDKPLRRGITFECAHESSLTNEELRDLGADLRRSLHALLSDERG